MKEEIAECVKENDDVAEFARWTAVESIYLRSAIDTVYYASVDEGCIPAGRLEEHEYQRLSESWDSDVPFVHDGRMETLRKHLRALKLLLKCCTRLGRWTRCLTCARASSCLFWSACARP